MRAIWKGSVSFGLVNVPVKLYSATEDHDVPLHMVHDADGGRIRYQRRCEKCGRIVAYDHIDKVYDDGEHKVVLTEEDLSTLPEERGREIEVVEFVPDDQVDPIMLDRSYYLEPDGRSVKAYVLLRRTLEAEDRTAIVRFALRQRTRLAALRVRGKALMVQTLLWDDEIRDADFDVLDQRVRLNEREKSMSEELILSFATDFHPERFTDEYQAQLRELVDRKLATGEALESDDEGADEADGEVLDLSEALRRSIERNKGKGARRRKSGSSKRRAG